MTWFVALGIAIALILLCYVVLIVLARRLPPGLLRDLVEFLPACVTTARRLRRNASVPRSAKVALLVAGLWVLSPIDLIPEFLPVIGPLDDIVVVVLAFRYAARSIPRSVFYEAWPAEPRLVRRLVGDVPATEEQERRPQDGGPRGGVAGGGGGI